MVVRFLYSLILSQQGGDSQGRLSHKRPLFIAYCTQVWFASMLLGRGFSQLQEAIRKFASIAALLALLLPGVSSLAETLSAADLPACCNTAYCPLHHRQMSDLQRDKSNCGAMGGPGQKKCAMRACDAAPSPAVATNVFVVRTPLALRAPAAAEAAPAMAPSLFATVSAIPLTPPPRTNLN